MSASLHWLELALDDRVEGIAERTSPWSKGTRTFQLELVRLGRVGVQVGRPEHRERIRRRISVNRFLAAVGRRFRVPDVIADGADAELPFVATRWVEGRPGNAFLATPSEARQAANELHGVVEELGRLPPAPIDLPAIWADPERLRQAAGHWLEAVAPRLGGRARDVVSDCVERTMTALDFGTLAFAHGDVVPVNILIDERGIVTVFDFEDARLALDGFDRAMLWTTLALHHPEAATAYESMVAKSQSAPFDRDKLATAGCLQRLERASESLAGLGDETAAMSELDAAAQLVARVRQRLWD